MRPSSPLGSMSVLVQVALLAVFAVIASQVVAFAVVLTAPPPRPAGFSIAAASDALQGKPARTSDGRDLRRDLSEQPGLPDAPLSPLETAIRIGLAARLGQPPDTVRVRIAPHTPPRTMPWTAGSPRVRPDGDPGRAVDRSETIIFSHRMTAESGHRGGAHGVDANALAGALGEALARNGPQGGDGRSEVTVQMVQPADRQTRFTVLADRLTFAPFAASVRMADGRWATVEPPRGWIDPWQARLLMALGITALLLAPAVWLMARRLTRPIRVFAEAAGRLGADPDAPPLTPSGPSEVRTAIAAFNDMQASLRGHMRQRTQTIAAIAHDLRTPLTRLRFRAEQAPEALRDRMATDVEEMDALIGQAMAFVRGEAPAERSEQVDLGALTADCARGFAETGQDVTYAGTFGLTVRADPAALRRAITNLIDNAVTFAGGAQVVGRVEDGRAVIAVLDHGPGVPAAELETVFEPFRRGERSRNRQTGGTGLGLAVARQAARAAGGDVVLLNREGGGLEARLTLPLA